MPTTLRLLNSLPNFTTQAYRYGIALSCIGVLVNWLGVAQAYIEPVRYLGVGLVIIGSFLIISAMCRWMFLTPHPSAAQEVREPNPESGGDLHVITVPMGQSHTRPRQPGFSLATQGKPPDYFMVAEKPPSYEEAMSMLPLCTRASCSSSLQLNTGGGLEDFLAPHQVPESHPEGATGGASPQPPQARSLSLQSEYEEGPSSPTRTPPPAYSSQLSLCASLHGSQCSPPPSTPPPTLPDPPTCHIIISNEGSEEAPPPSQDFETSNEQNKTVKAMKEVMTEKPEKSEENSSSHGSEEKE